MQKKTTKPKLKQSDGSPAEPSSSPSTGGALVAAQLAALDVERIFTVPGETFISALDGLYDQPQIQTILCRNESGAAMMAEAHAKLTGKPGVVFVTRAPGLANTIPGIVVARQDHTPLIVLVGLANTRVENHGDLQISEFEALMGALSKSVSIVRDPDRLPETLVHAFHQAQSGRPGPVAIGLPEDCLNASSNAALLAPSRITTGKPTSKQIAAIGRALENADAPLILVGGGPWSKKAQAHVETIAERFNIPITAAFRCQDFVDNRHHCYAGHAGIAIRPTLAAGIRDADLVLAIGANLGDVTTGGYTLIKSPQPNQTLIHVMPGGEDLANTITADIAMVCRPETFLKALSKLNPPKTCRWTKWRENLRTAYTESLQPTPTPGPVQLEKVVRSLSDTLPPSAIVTNGAGNYTQFVHRYFAYKGYQTGLAPAAGSMGYGLPAAIAAKLSQPKRTVVAFAGDGCLMMTVQELATAVQYGANIIVIVVNNGILGTIRMHQEQRFPNRVIATTLTNPDFVALAESFGAYGEQVKKTSDFAPAFKRALNCNRPALIELVIDSEAITPEESLSEIRNSGV